MQPTTPPTKPASKSKVGVALHDAASSLLGDLAIFRPRLYTEAAVQALRGFIGTNVSSHYSTAYYDNMCAVVNRNRGSASRDVRLDVDLADTGLVVAKQGSSNINSGFRW